MIKSQIPESGIGITQRAKAGPSAKQPERDAIAAQIEEFLKGGGKIHKLVGPHESVDIDYLRPKGNG